MEAYILISWFDGESHPHYDNIHLNKAKLQAECDEANNKLTEFDKSWGIHFEIETIQIIE